MNFLALTSDAGDAAPGVIRAAALHEHPRGGTTQNAKSAVLSPFKGGDDKSPRRGDKSPYSPQRRLAWAVGRGESCRQVKIHLEIDPKHASRGNFGKLPAS